MPLKLDPALKKYWAIRTAVDKGITGVIDCVDDTDTSIGTYSATALRETYGFLQRNRVKIETAALLTFMGTLFKGYKTEEEGSFNAAAMQYEALLADAAIDALRELLQATYTLSYYGLIGCTGSAILAGGKMISNYFNLATVSVADERSEETHLHTR